MTYVHLQNVYTSSTTWSPARPTPPSTNTVVCMYVASVWPVSSPLGLSPCKPASADQCGRVHQLYYHRKSLWKLHGRHTLSATSAAAATTAAAAAAAGQEKQCCAVQRQTAVTAYLKSKQLPLFVFALRSVQELQQQREPCTARAPMLSRDCRSGRWFNGLCQPLGDLVSRANSVDERSGIQRCF